MAIVIPTRTGSHGEKNGLQRLLLQRDDDDGESAADDGDGEPAYRWAQPDGAQDELAERICSYLYCSQKNCMQNDEFANSVAIAGAS